jgi:hypothetical protein
MWLLKSKNTEGCKGRDDEKRIEKISNSSRTMGRRCKKQSLKLQRTMLPM